MSNGSFLAEGRHKVILNFFEYSSSKEYTVTSDIVEYDKHRQVTLSWNMSNGSFLTKGRCTFI
jgi:hypothetical protein